MFKRRAEQVHRELCQLLIDHNLNIQLCLNPDGTPKRGAFEIYITKKPVANVKDRKLLWSGLKRTPRAAKFPNVQELAEELKQFFDLPAEKNGEPEKSEKQPSSKAEKNCSPKPATTPTTKTGKSKKSKA